jgi:plastocyanin
MQRDRQGATVWFDPIGLWIAPGQTVRWVVAANVHTTTAYHPKNAEHSLRIPEGGMPWDSSFLVQPGAQFEVTLTVEGVYDYLCMPHEAAGMVGRIGGSGHLAVRLLQGPPRNRALAAGPGGGPEGFPEHRRDHGAQIRSPRLSRRLSRAEEARGLHRPTEQQRPSDSLKRIFLECRKQASDWQIPGL